jgi:septum site-determining protein MinD
MALADATETLSLPGKLYVGFADSSTEGIGEVAAKDRKWQMKSLRLINRSLQILSEKFEVDYVIFDSSPGFQYSSINAVLSSDVAVLVATPDKADLRGTSELIRGVYETLERKIGVILNKVPTGSPSVDLDSKMVQKYSEGFRFPLIGVIPCSCEVLTRSDESFFVLEHPDHPIMKTLNLVADKLKNF